MITLTFFHALPFMLDQSTCLPSGNARVIGGGTCLLLPDRSVCRFVATLPLPGVVILVHGVNSDGEWYPRPSRSDWRGRRHYHANALPPPRCRRNWSSWPRTSVRRASDRRLGREGQQGSPTREPQAHQGQEPGLDRNKSR
ncbi:hypothetical protein DNK49_16590 [Azoarcus communis]|uniref:T6SS Tle3 phospholipase effector alpha/beta domain-containing protein n=1 Tax=Parazoarcus communis SWub3 = DSM 12120 TaxID=1121029 RepID=A0A323UQR8_9RHOO|nr:hypothetical protein DNK49_16590 [Azoarcus communis] [Parazoarcus communis SWub3 = DSM 12120]